MMPSNNIRFKKQSSMFQSINLEQHNVIEASAGTGKTFTIEELVMELILEKNISLRSILMVTYTEKATNELRERIRTRLTIMLETAEGLRPPPNNVSDSDPFWEIDTLRKGRLAQALLDFDSVPIYTIHGFCNRILREFAFENRQLFEKEHTSNQFLFPDLFKKYLRQSVLSHLQKYQPFLIWTQNTQKNVVDLLQKELSQLLMQDGKFVPELPDFDQFVHQMSPSLLRWRFLDQQLKTTATGKHPVLEFYEGLDLNGTKKKGVLGTISAICQALADFEQHKQESLLIFGLIAINWNHLFNPPLNKKQVFQLETSPEPIHHWLEQASAIVRMLPEIKNDQDQKIEDETWLKAWVLQCMLPEIRSALDLYKTENGLFDFDDMLRLVFQNLTNTDDSDSPLTVSIREQYRYAIIDEFQDTDHIQWSIFKRLFFDKADSGLAETQHHLILIGDPKQAIYGFRGADVFTYLQACQRILGNQPPLMLDQNFRSTPSMIDGVNRIFSHSTLFTYNPHIRFSPVHCGNPGRTVQGSAIERGSIHLFSIEPLLQITRSWLEKQQTAAKPVLPQEILEKLRPLVNKRVTGWTTIRENLQEVLGATSQEAISIIYEKCLITEVDIPRQTFAQAIATEIQQLLKHPLTFCEEGKPPVTLQEKDICVLFRSKTEGELLARYLRDAGISFAFYKQKGLFQTREARDLVHLLQAIEHPEDASKRGKLWLTRFFSIPLTELDSFFGSNTENQHIQELKNWHRLAMEREYKRLFEKVFRYSEILPRELFLTGQERDVTNFVHLGEILVKHATQKQLNLSELILLLISFTEENADPGQDENLLRLESDRNAVQLMTMHASKGLEFPVVFVFGGFSAPPNSSWFRYHDEHEQWVIDLFKLDKERNEQEQQQENQRLLYVALTRAKARLYLWHVPQHPNGKKRIYNISPQGTYAALMDSLDAIIDNPQERTDIFSVSRIAPTDSEQSPLAQSPHQISDKGLDSDLARLPSVHKINSELEQFRQKRKGFVVTSYSKMKREQQQTESMEPVVNQEKSMLEPPREHDETTMNVAPGVKEKDLPGGANTGNFLHELLERVFFPSLENSITPEGWLERPKTRGLFEELIRKYGISAEFINQSASLVWHTLMNPVTIHDKSFLLSECDRHLREMKFYYPIPEPLHRWCLSKPDVESGDSGWTIRHGFLNGSIDFIFEQDGKVYFVDWKSDRLPDYSTEFLEQAVHSHYDIQMKIYTLAVLRWLKIQTEADFNDRFGGLMYLFLRGTPKQQGVYFFQPQWKDVLLYEQSLMKE
ncbi:MAG: UvrD-helicase domain-containing protein [SAR324 cluster bacterium]|nr:UvrD-helicase domain-containing protein [SAR324 cluster bacterium]